jgi:glycosyltransferase 2 family protein
MPALVGGAGEWFVAVALGLAALLSLAFVSGAGVVALGLVPRAGAAAFLLRWNRLWFVSYLYRYIPGKVVLVAERVRLGHHFGLDSGTSVLLVVWESGLLVAGSAIFAAVGYAFVPPVPDAPLSPAQAAGVAAVCVIGLLLFPLELRWATKRFPALAARVPGLVLNAPVGAQLGLMVGNAVCWLLLGLCFAATAQLFDNPTVPNTGVLAVWFVVSYVAGQVSSVTPAGLGVREAVLVAVLADVAPPPVVLAWAVANRLLMAGVEAVLLLASLSLALPPRAPEPEPLAGEAKSR